MAQVSPVRTRRHRVGRILQAGRRLDSLPRRPPLSVAGLPDPAAQQLADLRHLGADVLILPVVEPAASGARAADRAAAD